MKTIKLTSIIVVVLGLAAPTYGMEQAVALNGPRPVETGTQTVRVGQPVAFNARRPVATDTRAVEIGSRQLGFLANTASEDAGAVLVIPAVDSNEFVLTASKDLNVMCRVFDKELKLAGARSGGSHFGPVYFRGVPGKELDLLTYALGGGGRNTSCMYLQGYAAVFLMSVSFPLAPGPSDEKKEAEPNEPADVIWRQAEQELYGQPDALEKRDDPETIYDAAKVSDFQTNLLKTFKHAANTRCLAPDEWVITVVCGPGDQGGAPKMLVLRAKKSDIDSFSKGTLNLGQFREKVNVVTSPGSPRPWSPGSGRR